MQFQDNYLLSKITTLGIGGPTKKFVAVKTPEELLEALNYAKENNLNHLIIGGGSNLLVADEGFNGFVIKNEVTGLERNATTITVKSGALLQDLVNYVVDHGLSGLEKLAGIPGTVGGAVYGNAGAYGQSISDHITTAAILSETKDLQTLSKNECNFNYRDSIFKKTHDIILEITFKLKPADPEALRQEAQETLAKRLIKYPAGIKCPGSFFKNMVAETLSKEILAKIPPEKIVYGKLPAGTLLEEVGAKGKSLGSIEIAPYHANLFINKGSGTAKDFYNLAKTYALKVQEKFGIRLEPEVQFINLPPLS